MKNIDVIYKIMSDSCITILCKGLSQSFFFFVLLLFIIKTQPKMREEET